MVAQLPTGEEKRYGRRLRKEKKKKKGGAGGDYGWRQQKERRKKGFLGLINFFSDLLLFIFLVLVIMARYFWIFYSFQNRKKSVKNWVKTNAPSLYNT